MRFEALSFTTRPSFDKHEEKAYKGMPLKLGKALALMRKAQLKSAPINVSCPMKVKSFSIISMGDRRSEETCFHRNINFLIFIIDFT